MWESRVECNQTRSQSIGSCADHFLDRMDANSDSLQARHYCSTPISRFRKTNGIWEQWYDFVQRAGWAAVWWGTDEWRERLSLSRNEVERRELKLCDELKKDVWLCAFLRWKGSMNGVVQHSGCRLVGSVERKSRRWRRRVKGMDGIIEVCDARNSVGFERD